MNSKSYIIIVVLALAGLVYLALPQEKAELPRLEAIYQQPKAPFLLIAHGLNQELKTNGNFAINDIPRPLNDKRLEQLWSLLEIAPLASHSQERTGISAADAAAYGIDLLAPTITIYSQPEPNIIQWALKDERCYVYNQTTRRVLQFPRQHFEALNNAAQRLDNQSLLPGHDPEEITIDGTTWFQDAHGEWFVRDNRDRPAASLAIKKLFTELFQMKLVEFIGTTPTSEPSVIMNYTTDIRGAENITIQIFQKDDGTAVVKSSFLDQPAQNLTKETTEKIFAALTDLEQPRLFSIFGDEASSPIDNIVLRRADLVIMTISRAQEFDDVDGTSGWSVAWQGGLEAARSDIGLTYLRALNDIRISNSKRRDTLLPQPPATADANALTFTFNGSMQFSDDTVWVRIDGTQIENALFTAQLETADRLFTDPTPEQVLTRQLLSVAPDRISKVQRIDNRATWTGEVLQRNNGRWSRQRFTGSNAEPVPSKPQRTDYLAAQQLLRTVVGAHASEVAQVDQRFDHIASDPLLSWAARVEALAEDSGDDYEQLEETAAREWGLRIGQIGDVWWGIDMSGTIAYRLDHDLIDELFIPILDKLVFPLVSTQVVRFKITQEDGSYAGFHKDPETGSWFLRQGNEEIQADNEQVRAYLLRLGSLTAERVDETAAPLTNSDAIIGSVQCVLPGFDEIPEHLTLMMSQPDSGEVSTSITSSRQGANLTQGRSYFSDDLLGGLLPQASALLPADALLEIQEQP
jgi:hypothetical protein